MAAVAVNEYQVSSLLLLVQTGLLADTVAPVVFTVFVDKHNVPGSVSATGKAPEQSSLAGGGGTSCTQKLKLQ